MLEPTATEQVCIACIMIDVLGDFANRSELKLRDQIEVRLNSLGLGVCVGSGSGMGMMDIDFLLNDLDQEHARKTIDLAMKEGFADVKYTLDFTISEGNREDFLPEKTGCRGVAAMSLLVLALLGGLFAIVQWVNWV